MSYYYASDATIDFINSDHPRVFVHGGNAGFMNFGDIIQLKGALWFWRKNTSIRPIIIFRLNAMEGAEYIKKTKEWYGCKSIVFVSDYLVDASHLGLQQITKIKPGGLLHLYGGGFLNEYWGEAVIDNTVDLIKTFDVSDYVVSGQQVAEAIVPVLEKKLFKLKRPLIFGVRDKQSLDHMKSSNIADISYYSFDDVADIFVDWRDKSKTSAKAWFYNKIRSSNVLLHLNVSYYSNSQSSLVDKVSKIKEAYPLLRPIVAQAFNERRVNTRDSLQSLSLLEDKFPYSEYSIVNLSNFALTMHPERSQYPDISNIFSNISLTVSCSYHTAMLSAFFGIPTHLVSDNDFYSQKQKGLVLEPDFDKFLSGPMSSKNAFQAEMVQRKKWSNLLLDTIKTAEKNIKLKDKKIADSVMQKDLPKAELKSAS